MAKTVIDKGDYTTTTEDSTDRADLTPEQQDAHRTMVKILGAAVAQVMELGAKFDIGVDITTTYAVRRPEDEDEDCGNPDCPVHGTAAKRALPKTLH